MADHLMIVTSTNYHWVKKIVASTYGDGALKLTMHGDPKANEWQSNIAEINVFTDDVELTERLITAINGVVASEAKAEPEIG